MEGDSNSLAFVNFPVNTDGRNKKRTHGTNAKYIQVMKYDSTNARK